MPGFIKMFDHYPHKFNFDPFFSSPVKLSEDLNLKFRSKYNHSFTNYGCYHSAILKALYNFKVKREHKAKYSQCLLQNIVRNGLQHRCFSKNFADNLQKTFCTRLTSII